MPPEKADAGRIWHILQSAAAVKEFVAGKSFEEFARDKLLRSAVERQVTIIGEAASRLSKELRAGNPQIPWEKIISTRHIIVHEYDRVLMDTMWRIATVHVPALASQIAPLLPPEPPDLLPDPD